MTTVWYRYLLYNSEASIFVLLWSVGLAEEDRQTSEKVVLFLRHKVADTFPTTSIFPVFSYFLRLSLCLFLMG
jgi:hypothetical protein